MARGDQRERDRAKKLARLQKEQKGGPKVSRKGNENLYRIMLLAQVQLRPHFSIVWEVQTAWNIEDIILLYIVPQKCGPMYYFGTHRPVSCSLGGGELVSSLLH
mmetsp:Transcript_21328/g.32233  ORF Transcript_21328/g.32233 Transcript_21328/m.32233 type:complete len:104 (-) Transcript_21328:776-1087(-)